MKTKEETWYQRQCREWDESAGQMEEKAEGMFGPGDVEYDREGFPIVDKIGRPKMAVNE